MLQRSRLALALVATLASAPLCAAPLAIALPTGQSITPTAAPGAVFTELNPGLASAPDFTVGQLVSTVVSPDGRTLLALTSGFNQQYPALSSEFVFVFDISAGRATQKQALQVPNSYVGLAFAPDGGAFYVSGGVDDSVHVFARGAGGSWSESGAPIALGNGPGIGLTQGVPGIAGPTVGAQAAGVAVSGDGRTLVVANYENDSISLVDLASRGVKALDLRPGRNNPAQSGVAGGEFPYWVAFKGSDTVYVSSLRDREIVVVGVTGTPTVTARIALKGNPTKLILNKAQNRLFVASDNSDTVDVIDTASNRLIASIDTTAPEGQLEGQVRRGSSPNSLALSPDEETLYVTNAGSNFVAVIELHHNGGAVVGLIPTGWYPNSVSVSADGRTLYVVNGKGNAGPNPENCTDVENGPSGHSPPNAPVSADGCPAALQTGSANQYVWQLTKGALLTLPVPGERTLRGLTQTVADNNGFDLALNRTDRSVMDALRRRIRHVIYIVKENRTYDQLLGDIGSGNGDASITQFPQSITPNFHAIASGFVLLDNFYCSGEVSMDGWQWSTGARSIDANDKSTSVNYAGRGMTYDSEGTARGINIAFGTNSARAAALSGGVAAGEPPLPAALQYLTGSTLSSLADPDSLPGTANEVELDGPDGQQGAGYIWNAALRAGKSVRNYGFFIDMTLENVPGTIGGLGPIKDPFSAGIPVAVPTHPDLLGVTDPYFRGFDNIFPDFYRYQEWSREFDQFVAGHNLPALELVRLMHDHMGDFGAAIDGVNTPEYQQADNDYAVGLLVQKVANSPYADSTLIFVLEDDAQDGPDHVDAHRSTGYIVGPYVKQGVTVSTHYSTVNMIRTIEDVLGLQHLNIHDQGVPPMTDAFDPAQSKWSFTANPSAYLYGTTLPLPPRPVALREIPKPTRTAAWWAAQTRGMDFRSEDRVDADAFNRIVWKGMMGERPYPVRSGKPQPAVDD